MELNYFKDKLFDLLNESDELDISDLAAEDKQDRLTVTMQDGSVFQVACQAVK